MLIGELVPLTLRYLKDNPLSPVRPTYDHVVVDEYQDHNRAEQDLLDTLASRGSLTIVGDEDQSIYSFKHANRESLLSIPRTLEPTMSSWHCAGAALPW